MAPVPSMFSRYEKDQFMELVPNEAYWDGAPELDKLVNRYFADETAAVLALTSGDIDFTYVSADIVPQFQGDDAFQVFEGPSFVTNLFNYNYAREPWNDIRVRQAVLYGVDREAILSDVFNGTAIAAPCHDPFPIYWPEDANLYEYDPDQARELLAEAAADGVDVSSVAFEIPTYYTSQLAKDILTVVQANLADVGMNVVPTYLDVTTLAPGGQTPTVISTSPIAATAPAPWPISWTPTTPKAISGASPIPSMIA